jgi:ClpP class serine protease
VTGILLDIDSPGGQAAGAFDCADMIHRLRGKSPSGRWPMIWPVRRRCC